jgi:SAM-dependent methyltransferase
MTIANVHQSEAWNGHEGRHWAEHHVRYDAVNDGLNDALFAAAAIGDRDHVLDVGCGNGQTTRLAARQASSGWAFGIDLSEPMLARARRTASDESVANVRFELGDAQVHPFPDGAFDVAISRGGVMYFADPVAAFGNIGRALRPGGRFAFVCGQNAPGSFDAIWAAMARHVRLPDPAEDQEPGPATFTDPDRIREVLTDAGFAGVTLAGTEGIGVYGADADDAAGFVFGWGPVRHWLRDAGAGATRSAREAVTAALRAHEDPGGVRLSVPLWVVTASVP